MVLGMDARFVSMAEAEPGWVALAKPSEPLLLKGYAGVKEREKMISPIAKDRQPEAIDRLIELYAATNQPDEVEKWRVEQAKFGYTELTTLLHLNEDQT